MATIKSGRIKAWVGLFGDRSDVRSDRSLADDLSLPTAATRQTHRARVSLARRQTETSLAEMKERAAAAIPVRPGLAALRRPGIGVIAELPSVQDADAIWLAQGLEMDGALAIGVGFEELSGETLAAVRAATSVPLLCTDLVISPYQIYEARAWGADMVRLLVAALSPRTLASLCDLTERLGMSAVVSVQSTTEADHALEAGARVISIATESADPRRFNLIAADMPLDVLIIAADARNESDVIAFERAGAAAVLVSRDLDGADRRALIRRMAAAGEYRWSSKSS
jgi:indole-3-glycerol phosphate synthase